MGLLIATLTLFISVELSAIPQRPDPPRLVNDFAGILSQEQVDALEQRLVAYNDTTSTQILVVIVPDLEGEEAGAYATQIGIEWGVGSEEFDNGAVILVKPKNESGSGEVFIAIGYGLEGAIPDARTKGIINKIMIPKFIENDYHAAIVGACDAIIRLADGEEFVSAEGESDATSILIFVAVIFGGLFLLSKLSKKKGGSSGNSSGRTTYTPRRRYDDDNDTFGGGSSNSGGFGGFGGGSFGGAGAGGKW